MSFNRSTRGPLPFNRSAVRPVRLEATFSAGLDLKVNKITVDDIQSIHFNSCLDFQAEPLRISYLEDTLNSGLDLRCAPLKSIPIETELSSGFGISADAVRVSVLQSHFDLGLDLSADLFMGEKQEAFLGITLQPGQILIINSCDYTATLDGENILETYQGDWIFLRDKSLDLQVNSDNPGQMEVKIDLIPRYL